MTKFFVPLAIAFFLAILCTPLVKRLAFAVRAVDKPDARKVHRGIMPRLGGLAICVAFWAALLLTQEMTTEIKALLAGGLAIFIVGFLDDTWGLSAKVKLLGQFAAACIVVAMGVTVEFMTNPFDGIIPLRDLYLSYPLTILWIIGMTNAVNLIDGLDGLAAGVSAISAVTLGVVSLLEGGNVQAAVLAFVLAAAVLGFLKYNFHPARIFMGDTGSLFLGFNLATIAIIGMAKTTTAISLFLPVVIFGIPILDTLFAIVRRFINGKPIFSPDKEHLHHRLLTIGLTHRKTVLTIYGVSALLSFSAILMSVVTNAQGMLIMVITSVVVFIAADRVGVLKAKQLAKSVKSDKAYDNAAK